MSVPALPVMPGLQGRLSCFRNAPPAAGSLRPVRAMHTAPPRRSSHPGSLCCFPQSKSLNSRELLCSKCLRKIAPLSNKGLTRDPACPPPPLVSSRCCCGALTLRVCGLRHRAHGTPPSPGQRCSPLWASRGLHRAQHRFLKARGSVRFGNGGPAVRLQGFGLTAPSRRDVTPWPAFTSACV